MAEELKTYDVYLMRMMSQVVKVKAANPREAAEQALDQNDLDPNVSNDFEADGDVELHSITDLDTDKVVWENGVNPDEEIFG